MVTAVGNLHAEDPRRSRLHQFVAPTMWDVVVRDGSVGQVDGMLLIGLPLMPVVGKSEQIRHRTVQGHRKKSPAIPDSRTQAERYPCQRGRTPHTARS